MPRFSVVRGYDVTCANGHANTTQDMGVGCGKLGGGPEDEVDLKDDGSSGRE